MPHPSHYPPYQVSLRVTPAFSSLGTHTELLNGLRVHRVEEQADGTVVDLLPCETEEAAVANAGDLLGRLPLVGSAAAATANLTIAFLAGGMEHPMASFTVPPSLARVLANREVGLILRRCSRLEDIASSTEESPAPASSPEDTLSPTLLLALRACADESQIDRERAGSLGGEPRQKPPTPGVLTITTPECKTVDELEARAALILDRWLGGPPIAPGARFEGELHVGVVIPSDALDGAIRLSAEVWRRPAAIGLALRVSFYLARTVDARR